MKPIISKNPNLMKSCDISFKCIMDKATEFVHSSREILCYVFRSANFFTYNLYENCQNIDGH